MKIRIIMFLIIAAFLLSNPVFSMDHMDQEDEFSLEDLIEKLKSFEFKPSFELYKDCIDKDILKLNEVILSKIRLDIKAFILRIGTSLYYEKLKDPHKTDHLKLSIKYNISRDTLLHIINLAISELPIPGEDSISNTER